MMLTINELAKKTGISSYEIRRRVHNGSCPHVRVGNKKTKILVDADVFNQLLRDESIGNMGAIVNNSITDTDFNNDIGYDRLRRIE